MKKLLKYMFVIVCSVLLFACKSANASGKVVYCSSIAFSDALRTSGIVLYVDNSYTFGTQDIVVQPSNSTVGYYFESANTSVVEVNGNTINAKATGTTTLKVKAMQSNTPTYVFDELTVEVKPNPMYVINCMPMYSIVHLQLGDTVTNQLMVNDGINVDNAFEVVIDDANVASYDYQTGVVSALGVGQTTVHITYRTGANTYSQCSFDVDVYVPATSVSITNSDNITIYVGDSGIFGINVLPTNYSMGLAIISSSDGLSVDNEGHYTAVSACNATVRITYYTAYGVTEHVEYSVIVKAKPTQLNIGINDPGTNPLNYYYVYNSIVDNTYSAIVSSNVTFVQADVDKLTISGVTVISKQLVNGEIVVTFSLSSAGAVALGAEYELCSYAGTTNIGNSVSLNVYNYITQPLNISLTPVSAVNDVLTLNMCNTGTHVNNTILTVTSSQVEYTAGYHVEVENNGVVNYNATTGEITSISVGHATITIATYDGYLDDVVITVNVIECLAESIAVPESINLFVGGSVNGYSSSASYIYSMLPECATDIPTIETSSEYLVYNNGTITASHSGEYTVTVSTANCSETTTVYVYDLPDALEVKLNNENVFGQNLINLTNTIVEFDYLLKVGGSAVSYNYPLQITSSNNNVLVDATKANKFGLSSAVECTSTITVSFGSLEVQFTVEFVDEVEIHTTNIQASDVSGNYKDTHIIAFNYTVLPANTTDELQFDYDDTYFDIVDDTIELKSTCTTITFPVDVQVTITSGEISKNITVKLYNYTTISTVNELQALDGQPTACYALANDIDITDLPTINVMNFVLLGNGHKLTNLNRLFALDMTQYAGMVDVIFDDVCYTQTEVVSGEVVASECCVMIVGRISGVIEGLQVNGCVESEGTEFLSVFGTLDGLASDITVNLQVSGYTMCGVFQSVLADAQLIGCTINLSLNVAKSCYIVAYNLYGQIDGICVTLIVSFDAEKDVYVLAKTFDNSASVQNYSFDVDIEDLLYAEYIKVIKTGSTSVDSSEINIH